MDPEKHGINMALKNMSDYDNLVPRAILKKYFSPSSYSEKMRSGRGCDHETIIRARIIVRWPTLVSYVLKRPCAM